MQVRVIEIKETDEDRGGGVGGVFIYVGNVIMHFLFLLLLLIPESGFLNDIHIY